MKLTFRALMDKLGIPQELTAYETYPFNVYDGAKGLTCSAEARMGMNADEVEGEIQLMYDTPPAGGAPMKQIIWFSIKQTSSNSAEWDTKDARLNGQPIDREIYNWEEKCCNFFGAVTRFLKLDQVPDIDELIEEEFHSRERFGGGGGNSSKSPKIKPGQLLGMKKGQGF